MWVKMTILLMCKYKVVMTVLDEQSLHSDTLDMRAMLTRPVQGEENPLHICLEKISRSSHNAFLRLKLVSVLRLSNETYV